MPDNRNRLGTGDIEDRIRPIGLPPGCEGRTRGDRRRLPPRASSGGSLAISAVTGGRRRCPRAAHLRRLLLFGTGMHLRLMHSMSWPSSGRDHRETDRRPTETRPRGVLVLRRSASGREHAYCISPIHHSFRRSPRPPSQVRRRIRKIDLCSSVGYSSVTPSCSRISCRS